MKVRELIEELSKLDPEKVVVLSIDEEGNGYNEVRYISDNSIYIPSQGEIRVSKLTPELIKQGYGEEDVYGWREDEYSRDADDGVEAVVLWP